MRIQTLLLLLLLSSAGALASSISGPLTRSANPNYFADATGKAIVLTGSHTWANFQEIGTPGQAPFAWNEYLDFMQAHRHNFMRLWVWEHSAEQAWTSEKVIISPLAYVRAGEGTQRAADGGQPFDLTLFNPEYFARLRQRVNEAGQRGIYVSVMLFQGWSLNKASNPTVNPGRHHPYAEGNNINGVSFPITNEDSNEQPTLHSMGMPKILRLQEEYVRKVLETVNDLDNVLFEVINEGGTLDWQIHMVNFVHETERKMPKQHMIGITAPSTPVAMNQELYDSPADWVSPAPEPQSWIFPGAKLIDNLIEDPTPNAGKVVILDTDHLWGHGGTYDWAWRAFCRGNNPIFMDPWQHLPGKLDREKVGWIFINGGISKDTRDFPDWEPLRKTLGGIQAVAQKIDLLRLKPESRLSTSPFCLAQRAVEYVIYLPQGGDVTVNLGPVGKGKFKVTWFMPTLDRWLEAPEDAPANGFGVFTSPFTGPSILLLQRR
ncbi:DUF6298 domain-containing protein [Nibricoccus sp. IMCC34717]|uniref:DUF6298 domain-containing protein n=1 Tax=Nibricoccus sp. IMCC34717 TaxID=3034021 RepID=UPI00384A7024